MFGIPIDGVDWGIAVTISTVTVILFRHALRVAAAM